MPKGDLRTFDEGDFDGSLEVQSFRGIPLDNVKRSVGYAFELEKKPAKLYIIASTERDLKSMPKLRIWVNDFSLSKEFKPNIELIEDRRALSTIIYDISPFGKEGKNELSFVKSSMDPLSLLSLVVVAFYPDQDIKTKYSLDAGMMILRENENLELESIGRGILVMGGRNGSARILTERNNYFSSYYNYESDEVEIHDGGKVNVISESEYIAIMFYGTFSTKSPEIRLNPQLSTKDGNLLVYVKNESEVPLDKVIMNLTVNGITKFFKVYSSVSPNQELSEKVMQLTNGVTNVNLRVVGIKSGMRVVIDRPLG